ncbi:hypothetical protein V494_00171 [Pseudogymnoascus sp. VKM F-4513 (FW-928)]|nr:hypothetical protein V494_00171 [Pseudogymnoascus sp. VKM F-4513 (FW-928)]
MADGFGFLNYIDDGAGPAPKDPPQETQDSDSEADNADRQRFWDKDSANGNGVEGSPNSSFNSSPTHPSPQDFPSPVKKHRKKSGRKNFRDELRNARTYGFRKNIERRVFKGSGALDRDESGNYDPGEEAAAIRRPAKKKAAGKSGLAEKGPMQYDSQDEEILPSIEEDVSPEETPVVPNTGKGSAAAGRKKDKGKAKASEATDGACASCRGFNLECSIIYDPEQYPCTACAEDSILCVIPKPKTQEAKDTRKLAIATAKKKKKDDVRMQKQQRKNNGKKIVQLAAQSSAPTIDPKTRKYIACGPCRAGGFKRCSLKTRSEVGPCKRCVSTKSRCTFEDKVIKLAKAGTKDGKGVKEAGKGPAKGRKTLPKGRPRAAPKKEKLSLGMFKTTIKTSFCHPITFDVNIQATSATGMHSNARICHFHTTPAFPMLALGEPKEIEVYGPKNPSPANPFVYTECSPRLAADNIEDWGEEEEEEDGEESEEREDNEEGERNKEKIVYEDPTTVCISCTFERQRILFCEAHRIRAIAGLKHPRDFDYNSAYQKIMRDQYRGIGANSARDIKWCSICVAPAFYECCSPDRYIGEVGCGLFLCEVCAGGLCGGEDKLTGLLDEVAEMQAHNAFAPIQKRRSVIQLVTLDILIERADKDIFRYEDGIRADARFLTSSGELKLWMESLTVSGTDEYEETETRMDADTGAGAAGAAGNATWGGWSEGMRLDGGHYETIEEYDLRMKLEKAKAELENPAFASAAVVSAEEDNEEWGL